MEASLLTRAAPAVTHGTRLTRMIQRVQKMVEVPQIQFIDKVVDALVSMQRQVRGQEQSDDTTDDVTTSSGAMAPHRKRKGSEIFQSHRLKAGMKERAQDDDHEHETLCVSIASADEIAPVHVSLCDGDELETRSKGEHAGATARQVDDILHEMKDDRRRGQDDQRQSCTAVWVSRGSCRRWRERSIGCGSAEDISQKVRKYRGNARRVQTNGWLYEFR